MSGKLQLSEDELIEWISKFETRKEMREESYARYVTCVRRGLQDYFPPKRTPRGNHIVGEYEKPVRVKRLKPEEPVNSKDMRNHRGGVAKLWRIYEEGGIVKCGRCHNEATKLYSKIKDICLKCGKEVDSIRSNGYKKDMNLGNVKDEFCHINIREEKEVIYIGLNVDNKMVVKLLMLGYGFIFKENYLTEKNYL